MKRKIVLISIIFIILFGISLFCNPKVKAATLYKDKISYKENSDGTLSLVTGDKDIENAIIPESIEGKKVTNIFHNAFYECESLTNIILPDSIVQIGDSVFYGCTSLKEITIPASVTQLGIGVFEMCNSLSNVTINAKITTIPEYTFAGCSSLKNVTLPEGIITIEKSAFNCCEMLQHIDIPNTVQKIDDYAFLACNINSINIPSEIKYMGAGCFGDCYNLQQIYFEKSSSPTIHDLAFYGISQLTFYGYSGTNVEEFAKQKGFEFIDQTSTSITEIEVNGPTKVLKGKSIKLNTIIEPSDVTNKNVKWSSSNINIAKVDSNGKLTGVNEGTVTITAVSEEDSNISDKYKVTVVLTELPFNDITVDHWGYSAVEYCYKNNIIRGLNDTTFAPNEKLTRGMLVTILNRMEGSPKAKGTSKFTDVQNSSKYYYNSVIWATENKIVSGYDNGKFGPDDPITREQLAIMLNKYCKYKGKYKEVNGDLSKFKDANKIAPYAVSQMKWAVGVGVITGNSTTSTLNPKGNATRAEVASMLYKYCTRIK